MGEKEEEILNRRCSNMALFCALMVVVIHVGGPCEPQKPIGWFLWRCCDLKALAVPMFFLMSGYFLAKHFGESGWYGRALHKRLQTLVLPFVVWNAICVLFCLAIRFFLLKSGKTMASEGLAFGSVFWWISAFGLNPMCHPFLQPLWFVRALLVLVVLSPAIEFAVRKNVKVTLVIAALLYALKSNDSSGSVWYFFFNVLGAGWAFFFILGMLVRVRSVSFCSIKWVMAITLGGLLLVYHRFWLPVTSSAWAWALDKGGVLFLVIGFVTLFPAFRIPRTITGLAFPIFLLHWMVLDFYRLRFDWRFESTTQFVFRLVFAVLVTFVAAGAVRMLPRRVANFLFGGR